MNIETFLGDTSVSKVFESKVSERCKSKPCLLGVDEAGRGPVLGPMVYGICYCPIEDETALKEKKFADSKTLTEDKRDKLFEEIDASNDFLGWMVTVIAPNEICNKMLRRSKYNLNEISHDAAIDLIRRALDRGVNVQEVYVDTVGDPGKYQAKLSGRFPGIKCVVSKKADSIYPIVSAASICAKVTRDRAVKDWRFIEKLEIEENSWGSGYPGDATTKSFLSDQLEPVFGFPQFVRFSWSTASKMVDDKCVKVDWEVIDDEDPVKTPSVRAFFKPATATSDEPKEKKLPVVHAYFADRSFSRVSTW